MKRGIVILYFLLIFLVLLSTLAPTVTLIDSGELIFSINYLNIIHPTGYPLFTILGRVFTLLPLGNAALKAHLLSLIFAFGTIIFFYLILFDMTKDIISSITSTTLLAFSSTLWSVSNEVEVYSLTALFIVLLIYLWLRVRQPNFILLLGFILGLALSNHLMIISGVLATFLFLILNYKEIRLSFLFFLLLGFSIYLFLLIRAGCEPLLNWGNPSNFTRFFWHISGKQYRVWSFTSSFKEVLANFLKEFKTILNDTGYLFFLFVIFGIYRLLKENRHLAISLLFFSIIGTINAVNYSIPDIKPYYLPTLIPLLIFSGIGLAKFLNKKRGVLGYLFLLLALLLPLFLNYAKNNKRAYYLAYDFAKNVMASLPKKSLVLTDWWDFYSPSLYLRYIEKFRQDLTIIDKELLRRSWYFDYLKKVYPDLIIKSQKELEVYLKYLSEFEYGRLKDAFGIQNAFTNLIHNFIAKHTGDVYLLYFNLKDYDLPFFLKDKKLIPFGLAFAVKDDTSFVFYDFRNFMLRKPKKILDEREKLILNYYRTQGLNNLSWLEKTGDDALAKALKDWLNNHSLY